MKVVKIINEYRIVINAGAKQGVHEGDVFEVYAEGQEIVDPDTGEDLGTLDYIKAKVVARDVFHKMTICVNRETETVPSLSGYLQSVLEGTTEKRLPLRVDAKEISGGFEGINKKIVVGDLVRPSIEDRP